MKAEKYTLYRIRVGCTSTSTHAKGTTPDAHSTTTLCTRIYTPPPHLGRQTSAAHAPYYAYNRPRARGHNCGAAGLSIARAEVRGCSRRNERYAKIDRRPQAVQGGASRVCGGAAPAKGVGMHAESTVGSGQVAGRHARGPKVRLDEVEWAVRGRVAEHAARGACNSRGTQLAEHTARGARSSRSTQLAARRTRSSQNTQLAEHAARGARSSRSRQLAEQAARGA